MPMSIFQADRSLGAHPAKPIVASRILFAIVIGYLLLGAYGWGLGVAGTLVNPDQIDYGEGIIWQQADLIFRGMGYKDIQTLPHIVFHYPPVFHLVSGLLAHALGTDQLVAGRAVSILSTFGILVIVGWFVLRGISPAENRIPRLVCAGIASLLVLNFYPIAFWSPTDRVDMLAIFLSLLGASFALNAAQQPSNAIPAALFFVAALFTKQTMIAAPLAAFVVLLTIRPGAAWLGLAAATGLGLTAFAILYVSTGGGFLQHVVGYNINRFALSNVEFIIGQILLHPVFLFFAYAGAASLLASLHIRPSAGTSLAMLRSDVSGDVAKQAQLFCLFYLGITTLSTVAALKSGAGINYLIEWMCACCILAGLYFRETVCLAFSPIGKPAAPKRETGAIANAHNGLRLILVPALIFAQLANSPVPALMERWAGAKDTAQFEALVDLLRRTDKPVISDNMVAVRRAGKELYLETAIIAELTALGRWDETPLLEQIRKQEFGFFVTEGSFGTKLFDSRYSPAVRNAIRQFYPRTEILAGHTIHFPP